MDKLYQGAVISLFLISVVTGVSAITFEESCVAQGGWYGYVSSHGNIVQTPFTLDDGRSYQITSGYRFLVNTPNAGIQADAQFFTTDYWVTWSKPESPLGVVHSFLQINGNDVYWADTPNFGVPDTPNWHAYDIQYTGQDEPIDFRIYDWYNGNYDDNWCHIDVCIIPQPEGCTPGFWKKWTSAWIIYDKNDLIYEVFSNCDPYCSIDLHQGLRLKGGNNVNGAKEILLRAAIAALLNEAKFGDQYPPYASVSELISAVNAALGSGNRDTILSLANSLDSNNNQYCPNPK
jgi:hypothetical protein